MRQTLSAQSAASTASAVSTASVGSSAQTSTPASSAISLNGLSVLDTELPAEFLQIDNQRKLLDAIIADIQSQTRASDDVNYITLKVKTVPPNVDLFKLFDCNLAKELGEAGLGVIRISYDGNTPSASGAPWQIKQRTKAGHGAAAAEMVYLVREALLKYCDSAIAGRAAQRMAESHWAFPVSEDIRLSLNRSKQPDNSMHALRNGEFVPVIVWEVGQSDSAEKNHQDCMSYFGKMSKDDKANIVIGILLDTIKGEQDTGPKITVNVYKRPSSEAQVPLPEQWVWSLMHPVPIIIQFPFRLFFADQKLETASFTTAGMSEDTLIKIDQLGLQAAFCKVVRMWCHDKECWTQEMAAMLDRQQVAIMAQFEFFNENP